MARRASYLWLAGTVLLAMTSTVIRSAPGEDAQARPKAEAPMARPGGGDAAHGQYLAEHVAMCVECHSGRDANGTIIPAERYRGGALPPGPAWAVDWPVRAPRNAGLPGYTDDEARRLLMNGAINRIGVQLKAPMPRFRMSRQDADDVIAFMRSLP